MKFHFALLAVLCVHALARDESNNKLLDATATSTGATGNKRLKDRMRKHDSIFGPSPKNGFTRSTSAEVVNTTPPSQSNGTSILSSCSGTTDNIPVGVQAILAKNGVEYVYLPMQKYVQEGCFEGYNNSTLKASDLVSCCDAAAEGKFNSFGFDGGVCTGFTAWLSPIDAECYAEIMKAPGLYIAKKKLSNFTSTAPRFKTSSFLWMATVSVDVTDFVDGCPFSKTLKFTTYSKTKTVRLDLAMAGTEYSTQFYVPELCDDNASADKRTVTVSILDRDGSVLASATEVVNSSYTGRHLLSNGVCVLYRDSPLQDFTTANSECYNGLRSAGVFAHGFLSFAYLRQELARLKVNVVDFWTDATFDTTWRWYSATSKVNMSLFNIPSLTNSTSSSASIVNVTDWLMYVVNKDEQHSTLCIDAPYLVI